jgi:hypothetical protein
MLSDICDITNKKQTKITKYFKKNEKQKETKRKRDYDLKFKTPNDLLYENNYWCR